jgi:hypothetical protein
MYRMMREQARDIDLGNRILSISHSKHLGMLLGGAEENISEANYPEYDFGQLALLSDNYTAVVSDQVLEHVACWPEPLMRHTGF